jgi:hypothetical protein
MRRRAVLVLLAALAAGAALVRRRRAARPQVASAPPSRTLPPRFLSVPWQLAEPAGEEAELAIRFAHAEGTALDRVDVRETPTQVYVTVIVRAAGVGTGAPVQQTATVTLSAPLGDRELVPGATDALYP